MLQPLQAIACSIAWRHTSSLPCLGCRAGCTHCTMLSCTTRWTTCSCVVALVCVTKLAEYLLTVWISRRTTTQLICRPQNCINVTVSCTLLCEPRCFTCIAILIMYFRAVHELTSS